MKIEMKPEEIEKIEKLRQRLGFSLADTIKFLIRKGMENVKRSNNPES